MKKFRIFAVASLLVLLLLAGCKDREAVTAEGFGAKMEEHGLTVSDLTADYAAEHDYVQSVQVAQSDEGWQVEFYVLEDDNYAQGVFNDNQSIFEGTKGNASTEVSKSGGNYSMYALTSGGVYMYVCKIGNTVGYARVDDMYKEEVKEIFDDLGY